MKNKLMALSAASALVFAACGDSAGGPAAAATVGGETISIANVENASNDFKQSQSFDQLSQQQGAASAQRTYEQSYLSQLIRRLVLRPRAEDLGVAVSASDVQARLDQLKSQFQSEQEFNAAVEGQGLTTESLDDLVRDQVLEEALRNEITGGSDTSEAKLREYYDSHAADYRQTRVSHILVKDKKLSERIHEQLSGAAAGKVQSLFDELARKHSGDPGSAPNGGDLGFAPAGTYVPEFEATVEELDVGEISEIVQTQFGFHIITVTDRRTQSFDDVKKEIEATLVGDPQQDPEWLRWLTDAYRAADIEVNPRYGELNIETQQVENASAEDVPGAEDSPSSESPSPGG